LNSSGNVDGGTQSFAYYPDDRLQSQTQSGGTGITTQYDPGGHPVSVADNTQTTSTVTSTYYLDGRPRTVDDGGRTAKYTYDGLGSRAARADAVDGSGTSYSTTYSYLDAELPSNMTSAAAGNGTTSWIY